METARGEAGILRADPGAWDVMWQRDAEVSKTPGK